MLLEIDNHSGVPIYRQVVDQLRRQILTGRLAQGEQLPSVRELARRLKVNPMTISKAYSLLEMEQVVERRRGVGLFAARVKKDKKRQASIKILEEMLRKAAVTGVQLGIEQEQADELWAKLYQQYDAKAVKSK